MTEKGGEERSANLRFYAIIIRHLYSNSLTGPVPTSFGNLTILQQLCVRGERERKGEIETKRIDLSVVLILQSSF